MKKLVAYIVAFVIAMFCAATILSPAIAGAEETRKVFVVGFDFIKAEVILQDENGYLWTCPFGKSSWTIGEEYELFIPDKGHPEIRELP